MKEEEEAKKRREAELKESKQIAGAIWPIINDKYWRVVIVALTTVISDVLEMCPSGDRRKKAFDMITEALRATTEME